LDYLTTHTSLSPIRRGFTLGFVNYKKGCTRLAATSDKAYQLLANGRWFSPGTLASSTTKTGRHDIAEILLKVALNIINQSILKSDITDCLIHHIISNKSEHRSNAVDTKINLCYMSWLFVCLMNVGERWLFVLLILVELLTITV